jgi:Carbohydrate binding module (family 35)/Pectate lyase superfamily protein
VLTGGCSKTPGAAMSQDAAGVAGGGTSGGAAGSGGSSDAGSPDAGAAGSMLPASDAASDAAGTNDAGAEVADAPSLGVTASYEAETAFFSGGTSASSAVGGFTGSGYVTGFSSEGAQVVFAVNAPSSGSYDVALRYANGGGKATLTITINGLPAKVTSLAGTGAAGSWGTQTEALALRAGLNTIGYRREATDVGTGAVDLDALLVPRGLPLAARGATVPYVEQEAEAAATTGTTLPPSRQYLSVSSEASGRQAVVLGATGQQVSFTLTARANALVVRFSIPDSADGAGQDATIGLYAGATKLADLALTSRYAWVYGDYPFASPPSAGSAHRFFDEARTLMPEQPAGTVISLRKDAASTASATIDLVDFEEVEAAAPMPPGFVSIASHGAIADDGQDDTDAISATVADAEAAHRGVFIPAGTFEINALVNVNGVTVAGAGPWRSVLHGKNARGGLYAQGGVVKLLDVSIFGDVRVRADNGSDTAIEGHFADGSLIQNVWIEHTKTGLWLKETPTTGLYVVGLRVRDTFADGVNLYDGPSNVRVDQSSIRNTGDDGLAMWSNTTPDTRCAFTFNTVQLPMLANGIGIYGGKDLRVEDNVVADTVSASAGIAISTRFGAVGFSGTQLVQRDTLLRAGGYEPNWKAEFGALWLFAFPDAGRDLTTPVIVKDVDVEDSTYQGILVSATPRTVSGATFDHVTVKGAGDFGIDLEAGGGATFTGVSVSGAAKAALNNPVGYKVDGSGNSGF